MSGYFDRLPAIIQTDSEGNAGRLPSSATFSSAARSQNYVRNCAPHMLLESPWMPPDNSLSRLSSDASPLKYYVIARFPTKTDTAQDRQLCGVFIPWDRVEQDAGYSPTIRWYPNYTPGTPGSATTLHTAVEGHSASPGYGDPYSFRAVELYRGFTWPAAATGYATRLLEIQGYQTAALGVWVAPGLEISETQQMVSAESVSPGSIIRAVGTARGGVGDLIASTIDRAADTAIRAQMRCMHQWGHGDGLYLGGTGSYVDVYGGLPIQCRCSRATSGSVSARLVVVWTVDCNSGTAKIKLSNLTNSTNTEYTTTSDVTNPTVLSLTSALVHDRTQVNEYKIEVSTPSGGEAVLHTISIWEE